MYNTQMTHFVEQEHIGDTCVCCGKPATKMVIWGRQY